MTGEILRTRRKIRARGPKRKFIEEIKETVLERGYSEKNLLYRCSPGPEDKEEWQTKLRIAAEENEIDLSQLIVALPQEHVEEFLDNGVEKVEVYSRKKLLETGQGGIYQCFPQIRSLITSFKRDPE